MNPRRVTEEFPRSLEAQLLRAGRELGPAPEQLGRTLAAVSILGANGAKATSLVLTAKWAATGLVSGIALVGAVSGARIAWSHFEVRPSVEVRRPSEMVQVPHPMLAAASVPATQAHLDPAVPPLGAISADNVRAAPRHPVPSASNLSLGQESSLGREVELIDSVRREVQQQRAARALSLLDDYARQFPAPRLAEEAAYLRILALQGVGRRLEAERASARFRARFTASHLLTPDAQKEAPSGAQ